MAQASGTVKTTSRQGTQPNQTLSFTLITAVGPPEETKTFVCSEDFFGDVKEAARAGKTVTATYDDTQQPYTATGVKVTY